MEMVRKEIVSNRAQNISEDKAVENKVISKNTKDEESSKFHYWTDKEEKFLVESRASMEDEFTSSKSHATLWQKLTDKLKENNINVSVKQAQDKWKNLKKKFKEVADHNNKTGNDKQTCKHQDTFSQLYGTKASTKPQHVIDTGTIQNDEEDPKSPSPTKKIRTKGKSQSPRLKISDMLKESAKKSDGFRHELKDHQEQKLARLDRFLDLFEKSL